MNLKVKERGTFYNPPVKGEVVFFKIDIISAT